MRRTVLSAFPAAFALAAASAHALDSAQLLAKITPSVYGVRTMGQNNAPLSSGSAVVVGAAGSSSRPATCWPARAASPCGATT